ncbi:bifunctional glycosyltransferase family 2 protein/CDP-glycerol:glycerophosphate glycerophosphotransferase [Kitasatospora sp. RB6PN24]|uniref:bifunctional glycosyltransferase/CDP-glycerol:glycerophosphate glycerophosphotransferase n=1 Tax=Kitasatospora humi TaxID=2893891 RepID=UPI001E32C78E|nr:CDP-glycerol glycerophosphotransferase family protein [Kitasatospora humi]MCC9310515.1 bifunctional glycosyltransferase family 2 protein/CDP-glycerol:glycerophosphate glycerophosphotransferase [Kitasatospora humi]
MAPRLSVVVPIYNVERYLQECLESIAAQTMGDLECIMVDDGSKDGSAAIAEAFAARDSRFRLVRKQNAGLGAARNTGLLHLTEGTEFLAFVDSDDTLPPSAYELMISTLDKTGSDFCTGNVLRFRAVGYYQSGGHAKPFRETVLKTHITERPELVTDRTAWNKVYRRSFWDRAGLLYPEGILYEDAPVSVPHHYMAKRVDVLADPIYHWREREVGEMSITQMRTNPKGLIDRVTSMELVRAWLGKQPEPKYRDYLHSYDENNLVEEIPMFFWSVVDGEQDYRDAYVQCVGRLLRAIGPEHVKKLRAPLRLKYYLTLQGRIDEFVEQMRFESESNGAAPARGLLRPYADYPFLRGGRKSVPADVLRLDNALVMRSRVYESSWEGGKLKLTGHAFPEHLGAEGKHDLVKMIVLREAKGKRFVTFSTKTMYSPEATASSPHDLYSCDWSGFSVLIDPAKLKKHGQWQDGTWRVLVAGAGKAGVYKGRVCGGWADSAQSYPIHWVDATTRVVPRLKDGFLHLVVERLRAAVGSIKAGDGAIELTGAVRSASELAGMRLQLHHTESGIKVDFPVEFGTPAGRPVPFTARIPLTSLAEVRDRWQNLDPAAEERTSDHWDAGLLLANGDVLKLMVDDRVPLDHLDLPLNPEAPLGTARTLVSKPTETGHLQFVDQLVQPVVTGLTAADEDGFTLSGRFPLPGEHRYDLVLRHNWREEEFLHPLVVEDGRFEVRLPAVPLGAHTGRVPLLKGTWDLFFRPVGGDPDVTWPNVLVGLEAHDRLPMRIRSRGKEVALERRFFDILSLESHSNLGPHERSGYRQRLLRKEIYPAGQQKPLRDAVVYNVAGGGQYAGSPRAIHEELVRRGLPLEHLWTVDDGQAELPQSARALRQWSPEWFEALATAKYVVTSAQLPDFVTSRPGQVVLQTWVGSPLKRIGHDFEKIWFIDSNYLKHLDREVPNWTKLVSGASFASPVLRRAFGFKGELLETGYPHNDILFSPDREKRATEVRRRLGLPEGKKVVLYAPTYREDRRRPQGGYQVDLRLDVAAAREALGEDQVLLVRPHHNCFGPVPEAGNGYVWDVSRYPDMADLLLIADVLVTDYSASVFDFVNTGRPVLFFTYDLEHYRDNLCGFTFDFAEQAPGPLLRTSQEVVEALGRVDEVAKEYREAYDRFRSEYCDLDDGHAAARVVDGLLG